MTFWQKIGAYLLYYAVTAYCFTWRYTFKNRHIYDDLINSNKKPVIAVWHDQLLVCTHIERHKGLVGIASDSKDGELISFALERWGYHMARGSSTRGGVKAAIKAIKECKKYSAPCAITVDGPLGPRHVAKSGAVFIAKNLDNIILAGVVNTKHFIRFNSWDKFMLPLPFAKIEVTYAQPIYLDNDTSEDAMENGRLLLQKTMVELTNEASPFHI